MIRYFLSLAAVLSLSSAAAQTFSDNFDSYTAGSYLGVASSGKWTTWTKNPGGADDIKISAAKAHSGANSLYFNSVATNGGPADVVLPFGGEYNTGTFEMTLWLFVESGKIAYFNWQEQTTMGKGWTFDMNLDASGNLSMVNTTGGNLLKTTYTQNQWFKLKISADLNSNNWEIFIDDVSKGKFQNTYRQIASMDIFPTNGSSFYMDDVSYSYTAYTKPQTNGTVTYIGNVSGYLAGAEVKPEVEIRNLGSNAVTSAEVEISYNGITQTKVLNGLNISSGGTYTFTADQTITILPGTTQISATITKVNGGSDNDNTDNTKTLSLNPVVPAAGKMVIAEEATGTWCGWCPRGAVMLKNMDKKYHGFFQGIAVHNNDTMMNGIYDKGLATYISGYPSALVDRGTKIDPSAIETDFMSRILVAPKGVFKVGARYSDPNTVKVCVTTKFLENISGNYKIAVVLVEDSIRGKGTKFNQSNYYSGGGSGVMGGFEALTNPVPAAQMVYDHVARAIAPSFQGMDNAFGSSKNAGDSTVHMFTFQMGSFWIPARMHVIPMLIDPSGRIDNGYSLSLYEALNSPWIAGAEVLKSTTLDAPEDLAAIYPNPSSRDLNIRIQEASADLKITDAAGRIVYTDANVSGNISPDASHWAPGVYLIEVKATGGLQKVKWVKQ